MATAGAQDPHAHETAGQKDARMKWWREARFGMFIHWGLYAVPAGVWKGKPIDGIGEWIMNTAKIPVDEYAALAPQFDPVQFDADKWVAVAKAAGMKYIVMTAKHHDGFAMFHSADPFNIFDATPFKRNPIAEMAAACKKAGIKFGVYYSQAQDWHHAGGAAYGGHWDPKQDGDLHAYVRDVAAPQLQELMKFKPAVLWWDTAVPMSKEDIDRLTAPLPASIIMNNRLGNGILGDTETPEQTIPATGFPGRDWETCMTINDTWGYKSTDHNFKSTETLLTNLIDIASKGGNYLLNVGPDAQGVIPGPEVDRLAEIGAWLKRNGRSIYGTSASPYRRLPFKGRATVKGNSLFLHVFEAPAGHLTLSGLATPVKSVEVVDGGRKIGFKQDGDRTLELDGTVPMRADGLPTVLEVKLAARPVVIQAEPTIELTGRGRVLSADDATLTGSLQVEHSPSNIGYWTNQSDTVAWKVTAKEAFRGPVSLEYSCDKGAEGSTIAVLVDGKETPVRWTVEGTESWSNYRWATLPGEIEVPAGVHEVKIMVRSKPGYAVMNLRGLKLGNP